MSFERCGMISVPVEAEFSVDASGDPVVTTGLEVVDMVLRSERKRLPEVLAAIQAIRRGRRLKWESGYNTGGFVLDPETALVYAGWRHGPVDELPLQDLADLIERFLAFRYVPPAPRKRHG